METRSPSQSRLRVLLGLLLAVGVILLVVLARRRAPHPIASASEPSVVPLRSDFPALPAASPPPVAAAAPVAPDGPPSDAPIIDEIRVEHPEVCEGEENLITVKAHTPGGRGDAFLHYVIGSTVGPSVPLRASLPADGAQTPGPMTIQVFGVNNVHTSAPIPAYTIKKCHPDRMLLLQARQLPNSSDEQELVATVRELGPAPPLRATSYRWSFGDGEEAVTKEAHVVHRFVARDANALYSNFLVTCEAVGDDRRTVKGRTALSLRSMEFENLAFHQTLVLSAEMTPRFPQMGADGRVTQRVRLYHHRNVPVDIEQASITYVKASRGGEEASEQRSVSELLGSNQVPPGHGIEHDFQLDTAAHPGVSMAKFLFEGHTADGTRAVGEVWVMVPPALPTPETGTAVTDRLLSQKIMRARDRLGKPFVNDEELRQLELDGAFDDLKAAAPAAMGEDEKKALDTPTPEQLEAAIVAKTSTR